MAKKDKKQAAAEEQPEQAPAAAVAAEGGGKKRGKKRRRSSKEDEQNLPQDELARRARQRKLRDLALRLRSEGKAYKKGRQRKHKPRRRVQLIIVPIIWQKKKVEAAAVLGAAEKVQELLRGLGVKCDTDTTTELTPGQKFRSWEEKGVMLRVELGPKEATEGTCILARCRKAGEVAQKQTLAVGPALCDRVKQHLEEMGETLAPPAAAPAAAGEGEQQQGAAEPAGEEQQAEEQPPGKKAKKAAAGAEAAQEQQEQEAQQAAAGQQQQVQRQRQQGKLQSADDLEGDFAGMPLLGEQGPGKKGKKKQAAKAVVDAEVAAFKELSGDGGEEGSKKKKDKKHKLDAAAAVQQQEAGNHASSDCLDAVLGLLPTDGPLKDGAGPDAPSKVSPICETIEERIPAGVYTTAAAAAVAPIAEQPAELEPAEPADEGAAERSLHGAEEPQADATASFEWQGAQPTDSQAEPHSLEAAVVAALSLPVWAPAAPTGDGGASAAASPRLADRCSSAAHLSLQLQVAEALGDLQAVQGPVVGAGAAGWPAQQATGGEGGLARSASGSSSTGLSSPWRTSTSSFAAEPEASKRFSCCGSACPILETIRESISTQEQTSASLPAAPACPADAGYADTSSSTSQWQDPSSEAAAQPVGQFACGCAEAADLGAEVASLLGCCPSGPAPATAAAADQQPLADIFALLGQEAGSPRQATTAGAACPDSADLESFGAAIDRLLNAGGSMEEAVAVPAATATTEPAPTAAMIAGRLASLSQGSEAGWEAEVHSPAGSLPPDTTVAAASLGNEPADWMPAGGSAAPAEELSSSSAVSSCEEPAGYTAPAASAPAQLARPGGPPLARPPPSWSSDGGQDADPLVSMHERALHQRREAEQRYAQLRQQQEAEELGACTFRPKLLTGGRSAFRPGSTASLCTAAPSDSSFGEAAGSAMYARQQAQRQRQLERLAAQRAEQEREALAPCTFSPAVDAQSQRMFATGVRYGGSRAVVGGPAASPSMDQAVHRQLQLLHSAGLNAAAAAAVLASHGLVPADAEHAERDGTAPASQPAQPERASSQLKEAHPGDLSGATNPTVLQQAATSPTRRQLSTASSTTAALLSPAVAGRPLSASARLYAHAVDLQGRQRQAAAMREQKQRAELLAASPKAKPFPRAQHTNPPSPPLSRRSPPISRPGSAPPPGLVCASLRRAADELAVTADLGAEHPAAGRALQRSTTGKAASYWQRWGLEPGADFDGFLQRQEKFVQTLGAKLEAERQAPAAQQAVAATPGAHLSPGSRRLLERRRQRELARELEAAGCMPAEFAGYDAAGTCGTEGHTSPLHHSSPHSGNASAVGQAPSKAGSATASASVPFPYRPVITARAAAKPGRTPEELHAEAARRQEKLAQRRREAEQAALAPCTFAPDISPAAGSPLSAKFAERAKGHINLQDLDGYMREVRQKQAAREEAAAAAAKARQEQELAQCTFQPNLGHSHAQRSPAKQGACSGASAAGHKPGDSVCTSAVPPVKAARPPDVLDQVQALLRGVSIAEPAAGSAAAGAESGTMTGGTGAQQAAGAVAAEPAATVGMPGAGQAGTAADGFSAFLSQVTAELKRLQAE